MPVCFSNDDGRFYETTVDENGHEVPDLSKEMKPDEAGNFIPATADTIPHNQLNLRNLLYVTPE